MVGEDRVCMSQRELRRGHVLPPAGGEKGGESAAGAGGGGEGGGPRGGGVAGGDGAGRAAADQAAASRRRGRAGPPLARAALELPLSVEVEGAGAGLVREARCGLWADRGRREAGRAASHRPQCRDVAA